MGIKDQLGIGPIINVHCHVINYQDPAKNEKISGFMSEKFINSFGIQSCKKLMGIKTDDPEKAAEEFVNVLVRDIDSSCLDHVVVFAIDGAYDDRGVLDLGNTVWYVSNDFIFELAKRSPKIIPGCSINPFRCDWKEELDKCVEKGAALIKLYPSVMGFSPDGVGVMRDLRRGDMRVVDFYEQVAKTNLPILSHVGPQLTVPEIEKSYAAIDLLQVPLGEGVKVIIPHLGGGRPFYDSDNDFYYLLKMLKWHNKNIWFDCSGMSDISRKHRFCKALKNKSIMEKTIYGSDYPVPPQGIFFCRRMGASYWDLFCELILKQEPKKKNNLWSLYSDTKNNFDRDIIIKYAMGLRSEDFYRGYEVINFKKKSI